MGTPLAPYGLLCKHNTDMTYITYSILHLFILCVHPCVCKFMPWCVVWRSEDSLWESVLSLHCVGPADQAWVIRLASEHFSLWAIYVTGYRLRYLPSVLLCKVQNDPSWLLMAHTHLQAALKAWLTVSFCVRELKKSLLPCDKLYCLSG